MLLHAVLALSWLPASFCKIYDHVSDLPGLEYDFVIIGGTHSFPDRILTEFSILIRRHSWPCGRKSVD